MQHHKETRRKWP